MIEKIQRRVNLPDFARKRILVWALVVLAIVVLLSIQVAVPDWQFLPNLSEQLGPAAILAIFLVALVCEYIDSSLGMGYGTTLTPLLLLAGFEPLQIVPCVLLSECATGLCAAVMHQRDGNVDLIRDRTARGTAILLTMLSVVGAVAAVTLAISVPQFWLKAIIGVIILSVGVVTLATTRRRLRYRPSHMIVLGAVAAFNKGLSGGGYGPLVTSGQVVSGVSPKSAVAITSLAESMTCLVGLAAYMLLLGNIDWMLAGPLTLGAMLSIPVATLTVRGLSERTLRTSVGAMTCLMGLLTFARLFA